MTERSLQNSCLANERGTTEIRDYGITDYGITNLRMGGSKTIILMENKKTYYSAKMNSFTKEEKTRVFDGELKILLAEEEKKEAQILELSYDFSCRIIRLYKYLNEGKLSKADRDIVDALGRQLLRSATSINANMNEAQHPQSDSDFLSKASIALKEARESENWLRLLADNGYLSTVQAESLLHDCSRINKILITITSKVRKRLTELRR